MTIFPYIVTQMRMFPVFSFNPVDFRIVKRGNGKSTIEFDEFPSERNPIGNFTACHV